MLENKMVKFYMFEILANRYNYGMVTVNFTNVYINS